MITILQTQRKDLIDLITVDRVESSLLTLDGVKTLNIPSGIISQSIVFLFLLVTILKIINFIFLY